jgi:hypothetical protein
MKLVNKISTLALAYYSLNVNAANIDHINVNNDLEATTTKEIDVNLYNSRNADLPGSDNYDKVLRTRDLYYDTECNYKDDPTGLKYQGQKNVTESGRECLNWIDVGKTDVWSLSEKDKNYCRNPDFDGRPWCYVYGKKHVLEYQYCDIPNCPQESDVDISLREYDILLDVCEKDHNPLEEPNLMFKCGFNTADNYISNYMKNFSKININYIETISKIKQENNAFNIELKVSKAEVEKLRKQNNQNSEEIQQLKNRNLELNECNSNTDQQNELIFTQLKALFKHQNEMHKQQIDLSDNIISPHYIWKTLLTNVRLSIPGFKILNSGESSPKNVTYIVSDKKFKCVDSTAACENLGLGRAEFRSEEEEKFLMDYVKIASSDWFWLGAKVTQNITITGDTSDRTKYAWDSD